MKTELDSVKYSLMTIYGEFDDDVNRLGFSDDLVSQIYKIVDFEVGLDMGHVEVDDGGRNYFSGEYDDHEN